MYVLVALDGSMIVLSMLALSVFHPGRLLDSDRATVEEKNSGSVTEA